MNKYNLLPLTILIITIFSLVPAMAKEETIWQKRGRFIVEKTLGTEWSEKIFGKKKVEYKLPEIPYVDEDAKSMDVYKNKYVEKIKIDKEKSLRLNIAYVSELFDVIKERKGTGSEVSSWINVIDQGGSREGVYRAMVLDRDYQGMENYDKLVSTAGAEFAHRFSKRFAAVEINEETLKKINFYSVKRLVTEKALEIVDAFKNEEDLHQWYAVLSHEFARDFQYAFSNDVRQNNSYDYHLNWAAKAPRQHMKSEIIIKIHRVFNSLQKVQ